MLIAHYLHRLPVDHDLDQIRARAARRLPEWREMPDLCLKGFLLREAGKFGATANSYSSLYLWRQEDGFRRFLVDGGFEVVTKSFGRPQIETRTVIDACRGDAAEARFATWEEQGIPVDADLTGAFAAEIEANRAMADVPGTVAAAVGVDTRSWVFTRIRFFETEPEASRSSILFQVLEFARPEFETLPR